MSRHVVVTGSASGIGAACARLLREAGDRVTGVDQRDAEVIADLSTPSGRRHAAEVALDAGDGLVDAVIASAGTASLTSLDIKVNFFGVVELLEQLRPGLAQAKAPGAAVVSSISATHPHDGALLTLCEQRDEPGALDRAESLAAQGQGNLNYPTSKRALTQWVRRTAISDDWASAGISLNAVGPGVVDTPMSAPTRVTQEQRDLVDKFVPSRFGGVMGPDAVAETLIWLVRPQNRNITGQMLFIDGGAEAVLRGDAAY